MSSSTNKKAGGFRNWRNVLQDARQFMSEELWLRDLSTLPRMRQFMFACCRIVIIVVRGFLGDSCGLQASALTYITLMSLVPMMALMFSFSKGIGLQSRLFDTIGIEKVETVEDIGENGETKQVTFQVVPPDEGPGGKAFQLGDLPAPGQRVVIQLFTAVENTQFGKLGLTSLILLFWAVIKSISKVEHTFNSIWGVSQHRPLFTKLRDYLFILLLVPVIFLIATSVNTALSSPDLIAKLREYTPLADLYRRLIRLAGFFFIWFAFSLLYGFMPNTKVRVFPALAAGAVTTVLWVGIQFLYIGLQVGLTRLNAIYGTFAALPFFLAWLYANWTLVLFGAEVSFAVQHHRTFQIEGDMTKMNPATRIGIALVCVFDACREFMAGRTWDSGVFVRNNNIPARLMGDITETLIKNKLFVSVAGENSEYLPGRDIAELTPADIERAFHGEESALTQRVAHLAPPSLTGLFRENYKVFVEHLKTKTFREILVEEAKSV